MKSIDAFLNRIIHGDCIEVMVEMPSDSIDLVVTSPPYNAGIDYDAYHDKIEWHTYYEWCKEWLSQLYRILKPDGRCCINHYMSFGQSNNRHSPLMDINYYAKEIGFGHHGLAIWTDRTLIKRTAWGSWLSASAPYISCPYEGILILYKDEWKKQTKGETEIPKEEFMEACSGIWNIRPETNGDNPAPFPLALPERCIRLLSWKNDIVLDPFNGCGTTTLAAKRLDRRYIGIDVSQHYCDVAQRKVDNVPSKKITSWN